MGRSRNQEDLRGKGLKTSDARRVLSAENLRLGPRRSGLNTVLQEGRAIGIQAVRESFGAVARRSLFTRARDFLQQERVLGYVLIISAVLLLGILAAYPFLWGVYLSLQDKVVGRPGSFAGFENFRAILREGVFL